MNIKERSFGDKYFKVLARNKIPLRLFFQTHHELDGKAYLLGMRANPSIDCCDVLVQQTQQLSRMSDAYRLTSNPEKSTGDARSLRTLTPIASVGNEWALTEQTRALTAELGRSKEEAFRRGSDRIYTARRPDGRTFDYCADCALKLEWRAPRVSESAAGLHSSGPTWNECPRCAAEVAEVSRFDDISVDTKLVGSSNVHLLSR
ncbi:hypothetical protein AWB76_07499 [Caballeronia temeraria]|uniref:Uncharacterized protein n=1 Tax=Caballeronia temeraria TaxID=1777137 RepID=A0A158DUD8_9BURK|nr:hypothetical protein AWB76_07499 [Caballeronia temeraria]